MVVKQISVFVENKKGRLSFVTGLLADNKVNIRALSIADTTDYGILRLIVDNPEKVVDILKKNDVTASLTEVVAIGVEDKPGALAKAMNILYAANVGVEYIYAFIGKNNNDAIVIVRVDDNQKAIEAFDGSEVKLLEAQEVYKI